MTPTRKQRSGRALSLGLALVAYAACNPAVSEPGAAEAEAAPAEVAPAGNEIAVITVQGYGDIRLRFFPDRAPGHVKNFKKLARKGFYDGTTFHRIIPGFMIQGGDPLTKDDNPNNDGTGDPGYKIKAEFSDTPHRRGIVSMARASDPDSAGSQFFIVLKNSSFLDGKYTVFGEVIEGMETVRTIGGTATGPGDRPLEPVVIEGVRITSTE